LGLAHAIHLLLSQQQFAQPLAEAGRRNAARFRWDLCAEQTLAVYASALKQFSPE
jgi:glycosyltransferase involved in cell wall biosynthesis